MKKIFPDQDHNCHSLSENIEDNSASYKAIEANIGAMVLFIIDNNMLTFSIGRSLGNPFNGNLASNEQRHDL